MTKGSSATRTGSEMEHALKDLFGRNVFSLSRMRAYLTKNTFKSLEATICERKSLDPGIADEVAEAMKTWAISRGATHYTHWFQPLTGTTAERHDSFLTPDRRGGVILQFSGTELIKGEPDASSFPSGGLRATFEARGYTAWDPTSPAFIREGTNSATLCIPSVFFAYHGESLDKKTPLLRSIEAASKQICRLAKLFGINVGNKPAFTMLGIEQEYFLIDKEFHEDRLDLLETGRTLFGRPPAKHQQMEDHYFSVIKSRVMAFMEDLDSELWKLGIPAKTRHNEVAPAQFEIAPVYEELNLAVDHNMILMEVIRDVADQHGLACLLHEKPFAGVNGSGKHNNWSVTGPDGKSWLKPGDNPRDNARFLTMVCAILKAVHRHADLLRASVATAGNDHRLGAHEAPPAVISVYLGEQLSGIIEQIERGKAGNVKDGGTIHVGVSSLPPLPRDATDRNRTSPFAFTGTKFEFRAIGANQSCADPNMTLNTIVAEALDEICSKLESDVAAGKDFNIALQNVLRETVKQHKAVIFNGDNYSREWLDEAERRGLPNIRKATQAIESLISERSIAMFEKYAVLSRREVESRYEVYKKECGTTVKIEAECAVTIARTMILPSCFEYQERLASSIRNAESTGVVPPMEHSRKLLADVASLIEQALGLVRKVESELETSSSEGMLEALAQLRSAVDSLEELVPATAWPLPSYAEMMFLM